MHLRTRRSMTTGASAALQTRTVVQVTRQDVKLGSPELVDLEDSVTGPSLNQLLDAESIPPLIRKRKASPSSSQSPSQRKRKPSKSSVKAPIEKRAPPPNWEESYDAIRAMRANITAPVDTMGCDHLGDTEKDPKNKRFTTLLGLMLSSQTKDEVTFAAAGNIRKALGGEISLQGVIDMSKQELEAAICKVGFWRRKTEYIKQAATMLREEFNSDVPKTIEELCRLPGVGPKMGYLCLQIAWGLNFGIGVDIHVHRITQRLGWHGKKAPSDPEVTRVNLESWLPEDRWREINHMMVGFGQVICLPASPRCDECTVKSCPSRQVVKTERKTKARSGIIQVSHDEPLLRLEVDEEEKSTSIYFTAKANEA